MFLKRYEKQKGVDTQFAAAARTASVSAPSHHCSIPVNTLMPRYSDKIPDPERGETISPGGF